MFTVFAIDVFNPLNNASNNAVSGAGASSDLALFANGMLVSAAISIFCLIVTFICILLMTSYLSRIVKSVERISDNMVKKYQYDIERDQLPAHAGSHEPEESLK